MIWGRTPSIGHHNAYPMTLVVTSLLAVVLYLVATGSLAMRMKRAAAGEASAKTPILMFGLGAGVLHGFAIYLSLHESVGINLSFFNALSLEGWLISLMVILAAWRQPVENLAIALMPLAMLSLILMALFPGNNPIPIEPGSPLQIHILLSIAAYGVLTIAAVQAIALAMQDKALRSHQPGGLIRTLPPLRLMESLLFQLIGVGFTLLSLALLTGILFIEDMFAQHLVHKTILGGISWLVFGTLLWGRFRHGWRGRKAIRWTIAGFILLLLAYFGSKFVVELILNR